MAETQISSVGAELVREMVHDRVVRLGRAAGPDDVERMAAEKRRELFARVGQRDAGARAGLVHGRRIAADLLGDVQPGFARLAHDGRGGVVIEVNHRPDRIRLAAELASFLWAAVKASRRICDRSLPDAIGTFLAKGFCRKETLPA